jgi:hypothetical protein
MPVEVISSPSPLHVGKLDSLHKVRLEMTKLYREARLGTLETQEATKLVFILQNIAKLLEGVDLALQVTELEKRLERGQENHTPHEPDNSHTSH